MPSPQKEGTHTELEQKAQEGVRLRFSNPDVLRAFILNPEKPGRVSFAERKSGIREIDLGEHTLDGGLFRSFRVTLIVERDQDPIGRRPLAIIRTDLQLGDEHSNLAQFQTNKEQGVKRSDDSYEEFNVMERIRENVESKKPSQSGGIGFLVYASGVARVMQVPLTKEGYEKKPLVLFQIWDKDAGKGSISISLLSFHKYTTEWSKREKKYRGLIDDQWETDMDEVDRWDFEESVGIDVHEEQQFSSSLQFYEEALSQLLSAIYGTEGVPVPSIVREIEPPSIFRKGAIRLDNIGGQRLAKEYVQAIVEMERRQPQGYGVERPILLFAGPPGNGKTSLVQVLASELDIPLVTKTTRDLQSDADEVDRKKFFEAAFFDARSAALRGGGKSVLCFEGIEAFLREQGVLYDYFLNIMDEWKLSGEVIVTATSNFPENLHPGIVSRFEYISVPLVTKDGRKEILEIQMQKLATQLGRSDVFGQVDVNIVSDRLVNFSGRDIVAYLNRLYLLRRLQGQETGVWMPIDTHFALSVLPPQKKLGFKTPES